MNYPPQSHSPGGVSSGNILSKWFSEDVLQQAAPAQRHNAPDIARKVVSVEELERQQAAAINWLMSEEDIRNKCLLFEY